MSSSNLPDSAATAVSDAAATLEQIERMDRRIRAHLVVEALWWATIGLTGSAVTLVVRVFPRYAIPAIVAFAVVALSHWWYRRHQRVHLRGYDERQWQIQKWFLWAFRSG